MKKFFVILLVVITLLFLCSCNSFNDVVYYEGIESFRSTQGGLEVNVHILPSDDFFERFKSVDAKYYYKADYKSMLSIVGMERSVVVLQYDRDVYETAKVFCQQEMMLSDTNVFDYYDYTFIENIKLAVGQDRFDDGENLEFPYWSNMFAYNDNDCTLAFLGCYFPTEYRNDLSITQDNWGEYLEDTFSDLYEFRKTGDDSVS